MDTENIKDPVCGMNVDPQRAASSEHDGKTYYFCSTSCRDQFKKAPQKYAAAAAHEHGAHHHG